MKVKITLTQRHFGRGFSVVIYPVDKKDEQKLRRKLDSIYKKGGWENLIGDLENIRLPQED